LWPVAAHRIYLGQYIAAMIVVVLFVLSLVFAEMTVNDSGDDAILYLLPFAVFLTEGFLLIISVSWANRKIRKQLVEEIEAIPYAPFS